MINDRGGYFLLEIHAPLAEMMFLEYDNAEAARKAARTNEQTNPNGTRRLFKCFPETDPIEIMI